VSTEKRLPAPASRMGQSRATLSMAREPVVHVDAIRKTYGRTVAVDAVSFDVEPGEIFGLIGPNGAGKTTLLECLAGLLPSNSGRVTHREHQLVSSRRKEVLFYIPDGIAPWGEQRVHWLLNFFRKLYAQSQERLAELFAPLRLEEIKRSRVGTLSKGERKRLMLALGLLTPHPLLLLDEPFDGLDLRQTRDVMTLLKNETANGRSLLLSIHQLVDAGRVCDRLVLLNHGATVAEGTIEELRMQANLPEGGVEEIFLALT
jgi:ABC-2 type transport system ATP-binding protein